MRVSLRWMSGHHVHRRALPLAGLLVLAALLQLGAAVAVSSIAGFDAVGAALDAVDWPWLVPAAAFGAVSYAGYRAAYRGIYRADGGRPLPDRQMTAVVLAGWVGVLTHGGAGLDRDAVLATGACERDASIRVAALAGIEQAVLAIGGSLASIAVLVAGMPKPTPDFTLPWAILPLPSFCLALWLARRYADRLRGRDGWRDRLSVFHDTTLLATDLFRRAIGRESAVLGMALFWIAEGAAMWACVHGFGFAMNPAPLAVAFATGMLFTRRTALLGGAGLLMLVLPLTVWYSGAPLAVSVAAVFSYRVLTLWLPLPLSLAARRHLRAVAAYPGDDRHPVQVGSATS